MALSKYSKEFTADVQPSGIWAVSDPTYYILSLPFSEHAITNPFPQVQSLVGSYYIPYYTNYILEIDSATNDITVKVTKSPDYRFAGKISVI